MDEWDEENGNVGNKLYIAYDPKTTKAEDIVLHIDDPSKTGQADLLVLGTLKTDSKDYRVTINQGSGVEVLALDSTAGKACSLHPVWASSDCVDLTDGQIWVGMTYDMLVYEFGKPNIVNPSNYGSGIRYQYCWTGRTPSCFYDNEGNGKIDAYN
jgi:hypothetical protein